MQESSMIKAGVYRVRHFINFVSLLTQAVSGTMVSMNHISMY